MHAGEKGIPGPPIRPLGVDVTVGPVATPNPVMEISINLLEQQTASSPDPILPRILGQIMEIRVTQRLWGEGDEGVQVPSLMLHCSIRNLYGAHTSGDVRIRRPTCKARILYYLEATSQLQYSLVSQHRSAFSKSIPLPLPPVRSVSPRPVR